MKISGLIRSFLLVVGVSIVFGTETPKAFAQNQVICTSRSGKLFIRRSCKKGESKLNRNSLKGDSGPQGLPGRGVTEALASGTGIKGAAAGVFNAPGVGSADTWIVVESFNAVLPEPLTTDKVIISQKNLRTFCRHPDNDGTVFALNATVANDCLRTEQLLNGNIANQASKPGQFDQNATDNICNGTPENPTAPPGYLCIYLDAAKDFFLLYADTVPSGEGSQGFSVSWISVGNQATPGVDKSKISFTWAYTAP